MRLQPMTLKGDNEMDLDTDMMKQRQEKIGKTRLTPVEFNGNVNDVIYNDLVQKMMSDDEVDFVKEFDDYVNLPPSMTFPFSPRC